MCGYREGIAYYIYIFLGVMLSVGLGSMAVYCYHQRRVRRFVEHDNMNNNMQRHSLVDRSAVYAYTKCWLLCIVTNWLGAFCLCACSFIEAGEIEWQCTVCYHENHPAKRECLMCGTPQGIRPSILIVALLNGLNFDLTCYMLQP